MRDTIRSPNSLNVQRGDNSGVYQRFAIGETVYAPIETGMLVRGESKKLFKRKTIKSTYTTGVFRFYQTNDGCTFAENMYLRTLYALHEAEKITSENPEIYSIEL